MHSLRFLWAGVACSWLITGLAEADIIPLGQSLHGEAHARLTFLPPGLFTDDHQFDDLATFGSIEAYATADDLGYPPVRSESRATGSVVSITNGFRAVADGIVAGHSDLAALADGSVLSRTTLDFQVSTLTHLVLSLTQFNIRQGMSLSTTGQSVVQLTSGSVTLYSHTNALVGGAFVQSVNLTLFPGQYTLDVTATGLLQNGNFAIGADVSYLSHVAAEITVVPAPSSVILWITAALWPSRRKRQ